MPTSTKRPPRRRGKRKFRPGAVLAAFIAFTLSCIAGGAALAGLAMPVVSAAGTLSNGATGLFDELPTNLSFAEPAEASSIYAADGTLLARFYAENRILVGSDEINQHMKDAVVAIEDERFFEHNGIDPEGLAGAAFSNLSGSGPLAGGSTITQQYVKNLLIEEGRITNDRALIDAATERSMGRKLAEARYALALEKELTKDEILTGYLNVAMFGPSQYGVEAAARYFFNKNAIDLTIPESALLAGITQSPAKWNPVRNPDNAKFRRDTVLAKMYELGFINSEEFNAAIDVPIEDMLDVQTPEAGCVTAGISVYFCEYVVKDLLESDSWGNDRDHRTNLLYRGGLNIYTTIDPAQQEIAYNVITSHVPVNDESSTEMALSSIEPGTGKILAMVQNTNYGRASAEDPNATEVNLNVGADRGGGQGFQSGSTFKVFTLIEWLRTGHSVWDEIDADVDEFPKDSWTISCAPDYRDDYSVSNIEGIGEGMMNVLDVTTMSVNTAYVNMANQMDLCDIMGHAEKMGVERGDGQPLAPNPSAVLGANNVTPLSMANSMATLASGGTHCDPMSFTKIETQKGEVLAELQPNCRKVLDEELADETTQTLMQVVQDGGTGFRAQVENSEVAGKTGTTNFGWHAWFMGYTPQQATAVWHGHMEGNVSMFYTTVNGQYNIEIPGGLYAAAAFGDFNSQILAGQEALSFNLPELEKPTTIQRYEGGSGEPTAPTPTQPRQPAPAPAPAPTTQAPAPTTEAPAPTTEAPAPEPPPSPEPPEDPGTGNEGNPGNGGGGQGGGGQGGGNDG